MNKKRFSLGPVSLFLAASGLCGCYAVPGKVSGGGWMPSASGTPGQKAVFGFNGDSCDGQTTGHITYVDKNANVPGLSGGIMMRSTQILEAKLCNGSTSGTFSGACSLCSSALESVGVSVAPPATPPPMYAVLFDYASMNPAVETPTPAPEALVCAIDNGQGGTATGDDFVLIGAQPPFGSSSSGSILNFGYAEGNIKAHSCGQ